MIVWRGWLVVKIRAKSQKWLFYTFAFIFLSILSFVSLNRRVCKGESLILELFCKCVSCDEDASFFPKDRLPDNLDRSDLFEVCEVVFAS